MKYKLIITKLTTRYEYRYYVLKINTIGSRPVIYESPSIEMNYLEAEKEQEIKYIESEYPIHVGNILNGMKIDKVEIDKGEVTLYATIRTGQRKLVGKTEEEIQKEVEDVILLEIEVKRKAYKYHDILFRIYNRWEEDNKNEYIEQNLPHWVRHKLSKEDKIIYLFDIDAIHSWYVKTPLERYAIRMMFNIY